MALRIKAKIPPRKPSITPQLASKHFDIVLGLDFHFLKIPWFFTPCPITPFAAMVFDPMDYLHITIPAMPVYSSNKGFSLQKAQLGGNVTVNGCYRAAATTGVLSLPPLSPPLPGKLRQMAGLAKKFNPLHAIIPKPLFWVPPLAPHDGEVSHGSNTVISGGLEQSALFCRAFSCADIGRIVLNMPTGFFNNYATAIIAVLPFGKPVMVGGPFVEHQFHMEDLVNALMMMGLMKGAGKLMQKALGKLLTKMNKALMEKYPKFRAHGEALQPHICHYLGEPVDAASGHMSSLLQGFSLPGPVPFTWEARYFSDSRYDGPLGKNIYHSYDIGLLINEADELILLSDEFGCATPFPLLQPGTSFFNPRNKYELHRSAEGEYFITTKAGLHYYFNHFPDHQGYRKIRTIANRNGFAIRFNYDVKGRLVKIIDSAHREITVLNDEAGRITELRLPHPELLDQTFAAVRYSYDEKGSLTAFYDARGHYDTLQWQERLVTARRFRDGTVFHFQYNSRRQCIAALGPEGLYSYRFEYHDGYTIATNSLGYKSTYCHYKGLVNKIVNSQGAEQLFHYDFYHNLLSVQDEIGRVKNYEYDERGNLVAVGLPGQGTASIRYNEQDNPVETILPNGAVWAYEYDAQGNVLRRIDPLGAVTEYTYQQGLVHHITNAAGHTSRLLYNRQYALSEVVLPGNARLRYQYDALGRCTQTEDLFGNHQLRQYDLNGNLVEVKEPDGNIRHLQYDAMDNLVAAGDQLYRLQLEYNFFGDVIRRKQGDTSISFVYNKEGQLVQVRNERDDYYSFELDSEGRVIAETGFDGLTRKYHRDAAGQVVEMLRPGNKTTRYAYDTAGRITLVQYSDEHTAVFEYDNLGRLVAAANETGSLQLQRDLLGRLVQETSVVAGTAAVTVKSRYDAAGNRIQLTSSLGAGMDMRYNNMGYVTEMQANGWQSTWHRNEAGLELQRTMTGGVQLQWEYDRFGRPVQQQVLHNHTTRRRRSYSWGIDNRLLAVSDTQAGAVQFKHDVYGNLAELVYGDGQTEYRLPDATGNLFETKEQLDRKYGAGGKLLKAKGNTYRYDAEGNLVQKEEANGRVWNYVWNDNGTLQKVVRPDGQEVSFGYDALNRRVWKRYKQTITRWVWDRNVPLHEWKELDARNSPADELITWVFEAESFIPAAKIKAGKKYSIIADHLGTPKEMYREDGTRFWQGELDGYGRMRLQQGELGSCPFRYQGQYEDAETGLYYNRFRYYSPEEGMYLSKDPIGLEGGDRLYSYVFDPNTLIDPMGLNCQTYKTPHQPLSDKQRKQLKAKLQNRTITREEYAHLDWDRRFSNRRARGVSRFWANERKTLRAGGTGTRNWDATQRADILASRTPRFNGDPIEGHHTYNALDHPHMADDASNIYPATDKEHLYRWHGGNYQNDTYGQPLDPSFAEEF